MATRTNGTLLAWLLLGILWTMGVPACSDDNNVGQDAFVECTAGNDQDQDGYGPGCPMGEDCDDDYAGIVGPCQGSGCPQGFVEVPAGDFVMGCDEGEYDGWCQNDEAPRHTVTLSAYCIEETEVTVGAFRRCVEAGVCTDLPLTTEETEPYGGTCNYSESPGERERHPVNCVAWHIARHYCQQWLGGDLATEAQWEKAARGTEGQLYPWGDTPSYDCTRANWDENGDYDPDFHPEGAGYGCNHARNGAITWEVGSAIAGASPYGALDMVGNLEEWVLDCWDRDFYDTCVGGCTDPVNLCQDDPPPRVIRGGNAWQYLPYFLNAAIRSYEFLSDAPDGGQSLGFRCARPLEP